jgi:hypothetical protein
VLKAAHKKLCIACSQLRKSHLSDQQPDLKQKTPAAVAEVSQIKTP